MTSIINTAIEHENEIPVSERPTLSALVATSSLSDPPLYLSEALARTLRNIKDHVDEVVLIATGPSPLGFEKLGEKIVVDLNATDFPHLYIDEEDSPLLPTLAGESLPQTLAKNLLVASTSSTRELGQMACSKDYVLHLREGEILRSPEYLRGACRLLSKHHRRGAFSRHHNAERSSLEILLTVRLPRPTWSDPTRERPVGITATVLEGSSLDVQIPKIPSAKTEQQILYHHCQISDWKVPERVLLHLASSSRASGDWSFAMSCVDTVLARSQDPETRAWACSLKGDLLIGGIAPSQDRGAEWYERSLIEYPTWKASLRLCHARFAARRWRECQIAYELACQLHEQGTCLLDDSPLTLETSLLLSTSALYELGLRTLASGNCQKLLEIFPDNDKVRSLCQSIE